MDYLAYHKNKLLLLADDDLQLIKGIKAHNYLFAKDSIRSQQRKKSKHYKIDCFNNIHDLALQGMVIRNISKK